MKMRVLDLLATVLLLLQSTTYALSNLTLILPSTDIWPNPSNLPPSTHATLYRRSATYSALLNQRNTFEFTDITPGSYLLNVHCRDLAFAPLRFDVDESENEAAKGDRLRAWQTFPGNAWGNKGELKGESNDGRLSLEVRPAGVKNYYAERAGCEYNTLMAQRQIVRRGNTQD